MKKDNYLNVMGLKAMVRNIAKEKGISAQAILQRYFFEHFLDRLSRSEYRDNFVLKGGFLISVIAGLETRSTMDIDVTIQSYPLNEAHIKTMINGICSIPIDDYIEFRLTRVTPIRDDAEYGGFRASLEAIYENINAPLSIDITAGDIITPKPVKRKFKSLFDTGNQFELFTYNYETILAEKIETILRRSAANTRPRDFYDVYLIAKTQTYNPEIFKKAFSSTANHRGTTERVENIPEILKAIKESPILKQQWEKYQREYPYVKGVTFDDTINVLYEIAGTYIYSDGNWSAR